MSLVTCEQAPKIAPCQTIIETTPHITLLWSTCVNAKCGMLQISPKLIHHEKKSEFKELHYQEFDDKTC